MLHGKRFDMNTLRRKMLTILAVPLLAIPSAVGVYQFLYPISGMYPAALAAAGFELLYIGINILILSPALQRYARNVALSAVAVAVIMNSIAHYQASASWQWGAIILSLIASAPLAILAYCTSVLLHKLSAEEHMDVTRQHDDSTALAAMLTTPVQNTVNVLIESDSKSSRVKALAARYGVSESTMWRRVKKQPALLAEQDAHE
jgi:hypothetical protein